MLAPTSFQELNQVLQELTAALQATLGGGLTAVYLQGSFGMGDFDGHSDVDFMVVVEQPLSDEAVAALQTMHSRIFDLPTSWAQHLEGSYFPKAILQTADFTPGPLWFLDNTARELELSDHDNTRVVRWTTREHGIALFGPAARSLIAPVTAAALREEVWATMQEWGAEIAGGRYTLDNIWAQTFAAISYARMLHTLETGRIESKRAAVEWAREALDSPWTALLERAWAERPNPSVKVRQAADKKEVAETLQFIEYALEAGAAEMGNQKTARG